MGERSEKAAGLFVQPDVRRRRLTVVVHLPGDPEVHLSIPGGPTLTASSAGEIRLDFPDCELWSPDAPTLYTLRCEAPVGGGSFDTLECRFGMRECTVKDYRLTLNQRQIYLHGLAISDLGNAAARANSLTAEKLVALKEAGFNTVRLSADGDTESILEAADEVGLLVYLGMDCGEGGGDLYERIALYRNHPSLIAWILEDGPPETWAALRDVDPSRLIFVIGEDLGQRGQRAFYVRPYRDVPEPFENRRLAFECPSERLVERYLAYLGEAEELSVVGLLGADASIGQMRRPDTPAPPARFEGAAREYRELEISAERLVVDALRSNAKVAGYFLDGKVARAERPSGDSQAPLRPVCRFPKRNLIPREEVPVSIVLLNEQRLEGRVELSLQVVGPTGQVLWKKKRGVKIPRGGKELWSGSISASGSTGPHRFVVRLMEDMKCIAENSVEFFVFDPPDPWDGEIHLLDRNGQWVSQCSALASLGALQAPIHIVPPLANTIRAYPENELAQVLGQVKEGAVAIFFEPPDDWNDFARAVEPQLTATSVSLPDGPGAALHAAKLHPVFDGLPVGRLLGWPYRDLLPRKSFAEQGEEDICGRLGLPDRGDEGLIERGNDILVRRYGSGRAVFTHFRILDLLGFDPIADRLFVNLLRHFSRRSVRTGGDFPIHQRMVEWLRAERTNSTRRWMVIGMFSNWGGIGHETVYSPEETIDFNGTYPGWCGAATWRPWYALSANEYRLDIEGAVGRVNYADVSQTTGTGYAYSECISDRRGDARLRFAGRGAVKIWVNSKLVHSRDAAAAQVGEPEEVSIFLKQGRNTLLIKQSLRDAPSGFSADIIQDPGGSDLRWW
ncbi:MAG: hypothetical protein IID09_01975 [Candidatus Hydrogenedentes bacterium]|nr:hypothetical protein [Candidatus Hydrogenedentota bacterium]